MENFIEISLFSILTLLTIFLAISLKKEKKRAQSFSNQLGDIKGQTDDEMYGRGKFSELGLMTAGITHELSNPLSIILGRVTQLLRKQDRSEVKDPDLKKGLEQISNHAERMASIIRNLREYIYRKEDNADDFIPVKEIINDVLMFCGQRIKNHGIELRLKDLDNVFVTGHKGQFEQAILNLINNSFDAVDGLEEKWIEISAVQSDDNVDIILQDSGSGIPVEISKRMLEPFYTTKKGKGTGLGLPLVKGIAEKHGGDLKYVENASHTTFVLSLPRSTSSAYH
jgi:C4-dicarboxylate-specific signal transduction histidine kinase